MANSGSTPPLEGWEVQRDEGLNAWKAERNLAVTEGLLQVWPNTWYLLLYTLLYLTSQHSWEKYVFLYPHCTYGGNISSERLSTRPNVTQLVIRI